MTEKFRDTHQMKFRDTHQIAREIPGHPSNRSPNARTEAGAEPLQALESSVRDDRWMSKQRALIPKQNK